jgi:hypothetical protein
MVTAAEDRQVTGNVIKLFLFHCHKYAEKEFCKMVKTLEKSLKALLYGLIKRTV